MTFEEGRREFAEDFFAYFGAGDGLIETEVDFVGGIDAAFVEGGGEGYFGAAASGVGNFI